MSASNLKEELITIPNLVFLITGVYFAIIAASSEGTVYTAIGAVLCFISVGLVFAQDWSFSGPWRLATAAFSAFVLLVQLAVNFTVSNASAIVVASVLVNGALFLLMLGALLFVAKDFVTARGEEEEEKEEEEPEGKKKKLTYEI